MTRCIYCTETLLPRNGSGDPRFWISLEHIIPLALGGSDDLATADACDGCNNDLGATADSGMLHDFFVVLERRRFLLSGHSRKVPDLKMKGRSRQTGADILLKISTDDKVEWHSRPSVRREHQPNGNEKISIDATPEDLLRIMTGIKRSAEAKGMRMMEADGRQIDNLEESISAALPTANLMTEYEMTTKHDHVAVAQGLAKIALGFAHLALGPNWTFSTNAEGLRQAVLGLCSGEEVMKLILDRTVEMRDAFFHKEKECDTRHLIAILPMAEDSIVYVSLFGASLLSLAFLLPISPEQIECAVAEGRPFMVSLLPNGEDVQWELPLELTKRLAAHLPN